MFEIGFSLNHSLYGFSYAHIYKLNSELEKNVTKNDFLIVLCFATELQLYFYTLWCVCALFLFTSTSFRASGIVYGTDRSTLSAGHLNL